MIPVKMRQMPGDIPKGAKIAMMEGRDPRRKLAKSWRKEVHMRTRVTLRERTRREIRQALLDLDA